MTGVQTCALPIENQIEKYFLNNPHRIRLLLLPDPAMAEKEKKRLNRSEERRVGKEGRSRWSPEISKKKRQMEQKNTEKIVENDQ